MAAQSDPQSSPFIRQLASSDKRIRDRALTSLRTYLQRKAELEPLELRKLWKGLFYCMWMSDKPRNQQLLAEDLADLLSVVSGVNSLGFFEAFWTTLAAEWNNIDRLRMDKFLYLIRCYVNAGFKLLQKQSWKEEKQEGLLDVLRRTPLNPRDPKIPNGLRYHVIDIYVDELDKVDTKDNAPANDLIAPLRELEKTALNKTAREKAKEQLQDPRLQDWPNRRELPSEGDEPNDEAEQEAVIAEQESPETGDEFEDFGD